MHCNVFTNASHGAGITELVSEMHHPCVVFEIQSEPAPMDRLDAASNQKDDGHCIMMILGSTARLCTKLQNYKTAAGSLLSAVQRGVSIPTALSCSVVR